MRNLAGWRLAALACAAALFAAPQAQAQQAPSVPVMVGEVIPADVASCSLGQVTGLDPQGDNFLAVRSGPGSNNSQIDVLHQGDLVYFCDANGRWMGIVYQPGLGPGNDTCGVPQPISPRRPYTGPCRSGWVYDAYVEIIAG